MSLAFDAFSSKDNAAGANISWTHTTVGANAIIVVGCIQNDTSASTPTCTIGGISAAKIDNAVAPTTNHNVTMFWLAVTTAQAYTIALTGSGSNQLEAVATSYTGAAGGFDNSTTASGQTGSPIATALTTIADNCWTVLVIYKEADPLAASTGATSRGATSNQMSIFDSGAAITPAGSYSMTVTNASNDHYSLVMASFSPTAAGGATAKSIVSDLIIFN